MNSDLDMFEYPVDKENQTEDIFLGVLSLLKLCMVNNTIRNQDPGREAKVNSKKNKKNPTL